MRAFPFPDKTKSIEELARDLHYAKIPPNQREEISNMAWDRGNQAAEDIWVAYPGKTIYQIAEAEGLTIRREDRDNISGNIRYFSEYYSGRDTIILYRESIKKWAKANSMPFEEAEALILSHEIYHHLECKKIGLTSNLYTVPRFKIKSLELGKVGIRALSEIGAHGFSSAYFESRNKAPIKYAETPLQNYAVSDTEFGGRKRAEKIWKENPILGFLSGKGVKK